MRVSRSTQRSMSVSSTTMLKWYGEVGEAVVVRAGECAGLMAKLKAERRCTRKGQ
jgi:hypothetical protein